MNRSCTIFDSPIDKNALYAGILSATICGIIGTLVVVKRIVFIAGGVAHAAYGGIGLAFFMGWPVLLTAMGFSIVTTALMAHVTRTQKHRTDAVIGVLWAAGMALGIILTDLTPGYQGELIGYLFGSILAVSRTEVFLMAGLAFLVAGIIFYFYQDFLALTYDEDFARVRGVSVDALNMVLLTLIAVSVVMVIRVVGLILVIAMLTIPPLMVERYVSSMKSMIGLSVLLNISFTCLGLWLSYMFNLTSGASIIAVAVSCYGLSLLIASVAERTGSKSRAV